MIVVDASVAVKWFVEEEGHPSALILLEKGLFIVAPDLIFPETANVLWKKLRRNEITSEQAARACNALPDFFQGVVSGSSLVEDALQLANRFDHPVYDCLYLACAQQQGAKLVTADQKFAARVRNAGFGHLAIALDDSSAINQLGLAGDLSISDEELARVIQLSGQYRSTMLIVEEQVGRAIGGGTMKWINTADLGPALDSPARRRLEQALSSLSVDSLRDLVALSWLGRGFDGSDWEYLRRHASGLLAEGPLPHLPYIGSLLGYVEAGIQRVNDLRRQRLTDPNSKSET